MNDHLNTSFDENHFVYSHFTKISKSKSLMASLRLQVSASEIAKQVIDLGLGNVSSKQQILINYV